MSTFKDDERGYRQWLRLHPTGFVLNCERQPGPRYLKLHRATCWAISGTPSRGTLWTREYIKVCSRDRLELTMWVRGAVGGEAQPCAFCRP